MTCLTCRLSLGSGEAIVSHFQATFPRAMKMQVKLGMIWFLAGLYGWYSDTDQASYLILATEVLYATGIFLWTFVGIMPTNYELMGPDLNKGSDGRDPIHNCG